jgi:hypothetical protein
MTILQMPSPANRLQLRASEEENDFREHYSPWAIYRNHTVVLLRKYFRMSLEVGRMPSLLGGEIFRAKVTAYRVHTFEDSVIFVHDMEQSLQKLDALSQLLIARIYFEEFNHDEVAAEFRITRRQVIRRMFEALDRTTEILVEARLLQPFCEQDGLPRKKLPVRVERVPYLVKAAADSESN